MCKPVKAAIPTTRVPVASPGKCDGCGEPMGWLVRGRVHREFCGKCVRYQSDLPRDFFPVSDLDAALERLAEAMWTVEIQAHDLITSGKFDPRHGCDYDALHALHAIVSLHSLLMGDGTIGAALERVQQYERAAAGKAVARVL